MSTIYDTLFISLSFKVYPGVAYFGSYHYMTSSHFTTYTVLWIVQKAIRLRKKANLAYYFWL